MRLSRFSKKLTLPDEIILCVTSSFSCFDRPNATSRSDARDKAVSTISRPKRREGYGGNTAYTVEYCDPCDLWTVKA